MVSAVFAKLKEIATMTGSAVSSTLDFNPFGNKVIQMYSTLLSQSIAICIPNEQKPIIICKFEI